jgi:uncharacterized protein
MIALPIAAGALGQGERGHYVPAEPLPARGRLTPVLRYLVGGEPYLFVGETNAILALDRVSDDLVAELGRDDATDEAALSSVAARHGPDAARSAFRELALERIVLPPGMSAVPRELGEPPRFPLKSIVLNLAQGCNLSCSYCFADEGLYHDKKYGMMESATARSGIDMAFSEGEGHVHVTFFGGEPTMNWHVLVEAVRHGEALALEKGRSIDFSVTTNGALLTDERIAFLADHRIGVSVSLDGPPDLNDRHRVMKGGRGSSETVLPRIRRLLELHRTRPIGARVTLAAGNTEVERIFDFMVELGFYEVGFAPVTSARADLQLPPEELHDILAGFRRLADRTMSAAREGRFLGFSNLVNTWQELHEGKIKSHGCGAGIGLLSVGSQGGLYLCHRFTGSEEHSFGSLEGGLDQAARSDFLKAAHVAHKDPCQTCWLKHTCAGGCYHEAWERQGSALAPNAHYCDYMRDWMELALSTYTELAEHHPEFIARHLAIRMKKR